ncbi:glutathione S-transferase family protein [Litoribacillus peritrichatus]|uniref:Glutathione S-transferase N-terminal domain-containing protein n=1 Tax=Litoribacillus peritrichatus TaxID=718191 RepID=A0ABP7N344_9GAMM
MYTLHYMPGACSLATQVILRELDQPFRLVNKNTNSEFLSLNPVGTVPVLQVGDQTLKEGAAIILHLLQAHPNDLFPDNVDAKRQAVEHILFANATMHPAYGRLFFIAEHIKDESQKALAFNAAAEAINQLWKVVEWKLQDQPYLGGDQVSAADIMLAVYARWGAYFPVEIIKGEKTVRMLERVSDRRSFQLALEAEAADSEVA